MSTTDWRMDPDDAWRLYTAALYGQMDLEAEMKRQGMSDGEDLAEDAEGLRPHLLAGVSEVLAEDDVR